ncbi:hypothetical protein EB796_022457 [Bugula neritina]|uniref:Uncharacterized protein n=1 Tax=Bugula neritina TaxID=10212 RepID=A0A7J7J0T2_BUGNE|nr:hypothetical protein EB796_022457 [Bugula neritina]
MEGNVSSTSTTPDGDSPLMMGRVTDQQLTNQQLPNINADPSLSPLLKRQLNRFAKTRESLHKSPHLPRKRNPSHSNSTGSRTAASTIRSLSPPTTPSKSRNRPITSQYSENTNCLQDEAMAAADENIPHDISEPGPSRDNIPADIHQSASSETDGQMLTGSAGSDDDNENVSHIYDSNITEYDNMYSTDYGTYDNRNHFQSAYAGVGAECRELYSEIESDIADCDSLVGDTDYETEPYSTSSKSRDQDEHEHPLQRLQWAESKLLALLKPTAAVLLAQWALR